MKPRRKAREVARVSVISRHKTGCPHAAHIDPATQEKINSDELEIRCACPKALRYYRNGKLTRLSADTCDADVAREAARKLENGWAAAARGEAPPAPKGIILLETAIADFLASKKQEATTEKTVLRYKSDLSDFSNAMLARGIVNLQEVDTAAIVAWRNNLENAQSTRRKQVQRIGTFFAYAVEIEWIAVNPANKKILRIKEPTRQIPRALTDEQFSTLLAAVAQLNGRTTDEQRKKVKGILLLQRWTGLAIRDALFIERSRFILNGEFARLRLHRAKTGKEVYCTLRIETAKEILSLGNQEGRYLFVDAVPAKERERDNLTGQWGARLRKVGTLAKLEDENSEPYGFASHALRHTFVLTCLNGGLTTEDIAALIGDTPEVVSQHYSEWIAARQEKLNDRMQQMLKAA